MKKISATTVANAVIAAIGKYADPKYPGSMHTSFGKVPLENGGTASLTGLLQTAFPEFFAAQKGEHSYTNKDGQAVMQTGDKARTANAWEAIIAASNGRLSSRPSKGGAMIFDTTLKPKAAAASKTAAPVLTKEAARKLLS